MQLSHQREKWSQGWVGAHMHGGFFSKDLPRCCSCSWEAVLDWINWRCHTPPVNRVTMTACLQIYLPQACRSLLHVSPSLSTSINKIVKGSQEPLQRQHWWEIFDRNNFSSLHLLFFPRGTTWFNPWVDVCLSYLEIVPTTHPCLRKQLVSCRSCPCTWWPGLVIWILLAQTLQFEFLIHTQTLCHVSMWITKFLKTHWQTINIKIQSKF